METTENARNNMIGPNSRVTLEYELSTEDEVWDQSAPEAPLIFTMGRGEVLIGLEKALMGRGANEIFELVLDPSLAYGNYEQNLRLSLPLKNLPAHLIDLSVGDSFESKGPGGKSVVFQVKARNSEQMTLDGNHPLAGKIVYIKGKILACGGA